MRAARMYGYQQPLRLEDIPIPECGPTDVLVKVGGAGMCRTDFQLVDGYFREGLKLQFPATPGHEIAGWIDRLGRDVPKDRGFREGDLIVVDGGWGDETCTQCRHGNQQLCSGGHWAGFGLHGGYQEFLPVPYKHVIRVDDRRLTPEMLAPMTDAGLTPYRGVKKLVRAGVVGPGKVVGVVGIGGLGAYAVQYAKLLGAGATVVAFARSADKLEVAKRHGADHVINTRGRGVEDVRTQLEELTGHRALDGIIECAGAEQSIQMSFGLLATEGAVVSVGLVGTRIEIPLFPFVAREFSYHGSFWGNYNDLCEVIELVKGGRIQHQIERVRLDDVNAVLERLGQGDVIGRAVIAYD
jgi:alcohol dehydrogenase, propanol-preferring